MYHRPIHIFLTNRWQYSRPKDEVKLVHGRESSEQLTMGILCETCGILHPINAVTRKGDWSARKVGLTKPALQERENGRIEWRRRARRNQCRRLRGNRRGYGLMIMSRRRGSLRAWQRRCGCW